MSSITIIDLTVKYDSSANNEIIIHGLSCEIADGEFVCFLGPSGCGKTTMLDSIAGLVRYEGSILIQGKNSNSSANIGYVFQTPRLMNWLTIRENITFPLLAGHPKKLETDKTINHYLNLVGINYIKDKYPLQCSEGERARANIARALVVEPKVVLMDEPFSHLDELTARKLRKLLVDIWQQEKKTVLFVTHNAWEGVYLSDRVFVLSNKPSQVKSIVDVRIERPRDWEDPQLQSYRHDIIAQLEI